MFFLQKFVPDHTKIKNIQEGLSFSPEFCSRPYQNSGHTGGCCFFTRVLFPTTPKFRTNKRVFLFHQNFFPTIPKLRTYRGVFLFHQNFLPDHTKIQDIQEALPLGQNQNNQMFVMTSQTIYSSPDHNFAAAISSQIPSPSDGRMLG